MKVQRLGLAQFRAMRAFLKKSEFDSKRKLKQEANVSYDTIDRLVDRNLLEINENNGSVTGHGSIKITLKGKKFLNQEIRMY